MVTTADPRQHTVPAAPPPSDARRLLRSDLWRLFVSMGVLMALAMSLVAVFDEDRAGGADGGGALKVSLTEMKIDPAELKAEAGEPISIAVVNDGGAAHNFTITGHGATELLSPGQSETLSVGPLDAGTYEYFCEISGHKEAGMKGTLIVGGGDGGSTQAMSPEEMDRMYMEGVKAFPAKTKGLGGQLMQPKMDGGTKVFELTAEEIKWEIAPGDVRDAMAYNGQVPGPEIRVRQGDRVRFVFHNSLAESSSIHFHGVNVPNSEDGVSGLTQDIVKPGDSYTYEFEVPNSGTNIYHSHMNGATQIPRGLFGALIVEGPDEPAVDVDASIVLNDGPLGFTLNGKGFPATQPVAAKPGQKIRLRYLNEGLQGHPMHLHGMEQLVIAKDGWDLPQPYRADTIWVAPGERYDAIVEARPGLWAFHCHILSHAEGPEGMFGMVTVVAVQ